MRDTGPATLIDVARLAGVGKTTASDALTGRGRVSATTREAVMTAAKTLGYAPNTAARYLRKAATGTIAVVLPEVLTRSTYYMSFVFGIVSHAAGRDYDVTIVSPSEQQRRDRFIRADGLIVGDPRKDDPALPVLLDYPVPVVTAEHVLGDLKPDGVVWSEHERAMDELLDRIERTGARRPSLIVASDDTDWTARLTRGFIDGCRRRGFDPILKTIDFEAPSTQVREATAALLDEHPDIDAIVCGPDSSAVEVLAALPMLGRTTEDTVVVSCVDSSALRYLNPSVTAIDLRPRDAGAACAALLFDLIDGTSPSGTEIEHQIAVVDRGSTEIRLAS